jgi:hypothetical protein
VLGGDYNGHFFLPLQSALQLCINSHEYRGQNSKCKEEQNKKFGR